MANKKITDLQLISSVTETLNIPGDDSLQTYRFTAAQLKTFIFSLLTTGGDLLYASAASTPARLANGTLNQILKSAGGTSAPAWTHAVMGDVQTKTTTYTALVSDSIVLGSASGGAWTLTFPSASGNTGKILGVKKTDSSFNAITISGTGMTTNKLMTVGETVFYISDGTNWVQIYRLTDTPWIAFTPTGSWTTNTTYSGYWRRIGDSIEMTIRLSLAGAPTAATLTINIPNNTGWTIDTAKYATGLQDFGQTTCVDTGTRDYKGGSITVQTSTSIAPLVSPLTGSYLYANNVNATTPFTFGNTDIITVRCHSLPITDFQT